VSNPSPDTFTISLNSGLTNLNNVSTVSTNTTTLNVNGSSFSNPQSASTNQILSISFSYYISIISYLNCRNFLVLL
jgi:hypothetical protein